MNFDIDCDACRKNNQNEEINGLWDVEHTGDDNRCH
jgi:hypothetical protein